MVNEKERGWLYVWFCTRNEANTCTHVDGGSNARMASRVPSPPPTVTLAMLDARQMAHTTLWPPPPAIPPSVMTQLQNIRPDPLLRTIPRPSESPSPLTATQAQAPPSSACYPTRAQKQRKTIRATAVLPDLRKYRAQYTLHHTHTVLCFRKFV